MPIGRNYGMMADMPLPKKPTLQEDMKGDTYYKAMMNSTLPVNVDDDALNNVVRGAPTGKTKDLNLDKMSGG